MFSIQILILFMIASALIAVEAADFYASITALGVLGLELSLAFLLLKAPDIAIIVLALEMIALAALVNVISKHKPSAIKDFDIFSSLTFLAFAALFTLIGVKAFSELPRFGSPLMKLADAVSAQALDQTGSASAVAASALGFRVFDTLIAAMILFLTAVGIVHVTGKKENL